ncbi:MAG: hypothetical protein J4432_02785 [DPANN group archaeon]|nr:hypothetical protein [DPANN group archaeon]
MWTNTGFYDAELYAHEKRWPCQVVPDKKRDHANWFDIGLGQRRYPTKGLDHLTRGQRELHVASVEAQKQIQSI